MKIISKYKDYYDHLQGVYGVDPIIVLDRTEYYPQPYPPSEYSKIALYICDYKVEGIFLKGEYRFGDAIKEFSTDKYISVERNIREKSYAIQGHDPSRPWNSIYVLKKPELVEQNSPNEMLSCPILLWVNSNKYKKFPILKELNLVKLLPAHDIWIMLSDWIGKDRGIINKQTDKEKIISNGFDLKKSFRHRK